MARTPRREDVLLLSLIAYLIGLIGFLIGSQALRLTSVDDHDVKNVFLPYAGRILEGALPYRDVAIEYPPVSLLPIVSAGLIGGADPERYRLAFMAIAGLGGIGFVTLLAVTSSRLGAWSRRRVVLVSFATPFLLGSVLWTRIDVYAALLLAGALLAHVRGRERPAALLLGVAIATKVYPALLLPIAFLRLARVVPRRELGVCALLLAAGALLPFVPFLLADASSVAAMVTYHAARPLQVESLPAALLMTARTLGASGLGLEIGFGSIAVTGSTAETVRVISGPLGGLLVGAASIGFARSNRDLPDFLRFAALAVSGLVAAGVVFSPQYLLWLVGLVPFVAGRRGTIGLGLLVFAMALTTVYFPMRYVDYLIGELPTVLLVLGRDLALVALVGVLAFPERDKRRARTITAGVSGT